MHPDIESSGTGVFDRGCPVFLDQGMHSQDAADAGLALLLIDQLAELADLGSRMFGATQQLRGAERHFLRVIFFLDAISASFLAHVQLIPLHVHGTAHPSWRQTVIGRLDLHTTVQIDYAFSVFVVAEWF